MEHTDNLALLLEATVRLFHDTELVDSADAALSASFYAEWRTSTGDDRPIDAGARVGYRVPLFLDVAGM